MKTFRFNMDERNETFRERVATVIQDGHRAETADAIAGKVCDLFAESFGVIVADHRQGPAR